MEVTVQLSLDSSNVQHEKLALRLVRPRIEGFSVEPTPPAPTETTEGIQGDTSGSSQGFVDIKMRVAF